MAGKPTETSPLVGKSAVSWASGYGVEAGSIKAPLGVSFQVDSTEEHRCHLPRQIRPHSLAGIAIGAGSFAQGCAGDGLRQAERRSCSAACMAALIACIRARRIRNPDPGGSGELLPLWWISPGCHSPLPGRPRQHSRCTAGRIWDHTYKQSCSCALRVDGPRPPTRYDGTAIGFMLLNSFGGYVHMTAWEQGWVCSIFFFGGVIGAYMRRAPGASPPRPRCTLAPHRPAALCRQRRPPPPANRPGPHGPLKQPRRALSSHMAARG